MHAALEKKKKKELRCCQCQRLQKERTMHQVHSSTRGAYSRNDVHAATSLAVGTPYVCKRRAVVTALNLKQKQKKRTGRYTGLQRWCFPYSRSAMVGRWSPPPVQPLAALIGFGGECNNNSHDNIHSRWCVVG